MAVERVKFSSLEEATPEDYVVLKPFLAAEAKRVPHHILDLFRTQRGDPGALPVDMYTHGLLTGNYAVDEGADEETVIVALLHDAAHDLSRQHHGAAMAEILRPFISQTWINVLQHHTVFQGYYSWHHMGLDRNARDRFKAEPWYGHAVRLASWDQKAFNPHYKARPLEFFKPMLDRFFANPKRA